MTGNTEKMHIIRKILRAECGLTHKEIFFEIFLNKPEIRLYLLFSDLFGSKQTSVWIQINRKVVNTIWFRIELIRFLCVCCRFLPLFEARCIFNSQGEYTGWIIGFHLLGLLFLSPEEVPDRYNSSARRSIANYWKITLNGSTRFFRHRIFQNRFSGTKLSETNFPTPNFPTNNFSENTFSDNKFSEWHVSRQSKLF